MKNTFISKSARIIKAKRRKIEKTNPISLISKEVSVKSGSYILWIGSDIPKENLYGFRNLDARSLDSSVLVHASLLVVLHTFITSKVNALIFFAYEYGVPILWIHDFLPPQGRLWFFKETSKTISWELICQMAR